MPNYSFVEYTGDGVTDTFNFGFPYQEDVDMHVLVDGVDVAFTLVKDPISQVITAVPPASGTVVLIQRQTELLQNSADFQVSSTIRPADLDTLAEQQLYLNQEDRDIASEANGNSDVALVVANEALVVANEADVKADAAVVTADNAETKADAAVVTADNAEVAANNAVITANAADAKADSAIVTANAADAKSDTAITTADAAAAVANDAQDTADEALAKAVPVGGDTYEGLGKSAPGDHALAWYKYNMTSVYDPQDKAEDNYDSEFHDFDGTAEGITSGSTANALREIHSKITSGGGDMFKLDYDPDGKVTNTFDSINHDFSDGSFAASVGSTADALLYLNSTKLEEAVTSVLEVTPGQGDITGDIGFTASGGASLSQTGNNINIDVVAADMLKADYDPTSVGSNAFDSENHSFSDVNFTSGSTAVFTKSTLYPI